MGGAAGALVVPADPEAMPGSFAAALATRLPTLEFRRIREGDMPFLRALYAEVRRDELAPVPWPDAAKAAFLADQFRLQHAHYTRHYVDAELLLVLREGRPIGRVYLHRSAREACVMEISLLESERGSGLGRAMIETVLAEAAREARDVTLHVEPNNRAKHLYERLGFVAGELEGAYVPMRWRPGATP
ncbi:MAG TPA: GNAT family N-acetyltransferase [Xanthomonadales bacterium]|nr:GNAT family N-acetyltransferase [Xanthomonadales bacterium]